MYPLMTLSACYLNESLYIDLLPIWGEHIYSGKYKKYGLSLGAAGKLTISVYFHRDNHRCFHLSLQADLFQFFQHIDLWNWVNAIFLRKPYWGMTKGMIFYLDSVNALFFKDFSNVDNFRDAEVVGSNPVASMNKEPEIP